MNAVFVIARIALVLIFIFSGAQKLMDINAAAGMIEAQVKIPQELNDLTVQLQTATGMTTPQLLAILAGAAEILGALMIAANFGTRLGAVILIIFTAAATFYYHDFWNQAGEARMNNMVHAMKNLSTIGGLLVMYALGSWRPVVYEETRDVPRV
jgi:putative oxidoreductase